MSRKTKTPKWLSIFRKLYNYIGNTGLISAWAGGAISDHMMVRILIIYNGGAFLIQTICDTYFQKEPESKFPAEPKDLRE